MIIKSISLDYKRAFSKIVDGLFYSPMKKANETEARTEKAYNCIGLDNDKFCENMACILADNPKIKNFVDVGCGISEKVFIASEIFALDSFGIEFRKSFVDEGCRLLELYTHKDFTSKIIHGDARYQDYSNYDLIYFYCPSPDKVIETQIELQIAKTAKVGAIVYGNLSRLFHDDSLNAAVLGWTRLEGSYYYKRVQCTPLALSIYHFTEMFRDLGYYCSHTKQGKYIINDAHIYISSTEEKKSKLTYYTFDEVLRREDLFHLKKYLVVDEITA